jgi:hypothetical protein
LSFGQAAPPTSSRARTIVPGAIGAMAVLGLSYTLYARSAGTVAANMPPAPPDPASLFKSAPTPLPVPSEEQIAVMFPPAPIYVPRRAPVAPVDVDPAAAVDPPEPPAASPQNPGDSNQFN